MSEARPRWVVPAFALVVLAALAFSGDAVWRVAHLGDAGAPVKDWMTPDLVLETYGMEPSVLAGVLGAEPETWRGRTLAEIAEARGMEPGVLVAILQAVVAK